MESLINTSNKNFTNNLQQNFAICSKTFIRTTFRCLTLFITLLFVTSSVEIYWRGSDFTVILR